MLGMLPVFASYVVASVGLLWMIRKGIGGQYRAAGGGFLDIGVTTLLVYVLGSAETPFVAAYVAVGVLNAAVLSGRLPPWPAVCSFP